jgi:hypothetical protein
MASLLDLELGLSPQGDTRKQRRLAKELGLLGLSVAPGAGVSDYMGIYPDADGGTETGADCWQISCSKSRQMRLIQLDKPGSIRQSLPG